MYDSFPMRTRPFLLRTVRKMDQLLTAYQKLSRFSGTVLVAKDKHILWTRGYGLANHEHVVPNRPATVFRLASLSKPFTALAILQLSKQGKVDLHAPLRTYLPTYPAAETLTLHHLLTNSSGIPDYVTQEAFGRQLMHQPTTVDALITTFQDLPVLFMPGERFSYANSNWVLLGKVIETVSGQAYGDYVREQIFVPAQMTQSGYDEESSVVPHLATGYLANAHSVTRAAHVDPSTMYAAGGLYATVGDLHRWWMALTNGALLTQDSYARMTTAHITSDDASYGYGLALDQQWGRRRVFHDGGMPGFLSTANYYPEEQLFIALLSNFENSAITEIQRDLAAILFGEAYDLPSSRTFIAVDPSTFAPLVGTYTMRYFGRTSAMEITQDGNALWAEVHGLPKTRLRPLATDRYFAQMKGEVELTFCDNGGQPVTDIAVDWAGHALSAQRVAHVENY